MRIATFNVQNLRLRHGDGGNHLDGARDRDVPGDAGPTARALDPVDRQVTAEVLGAAAADVCALQEVFDLETLDHFHDTVLVPVGVASYPHRWCLPGNDGRGLDVALMSRVAPGDVTTHAALKPEDLSLDTPEGFGDQPIFRRDCLQVEIGRLTLFICHFKAPWPDAPASWPVRRMEAEAVRDLVVARGNPLWLIAGDLNDPDPPGTPGRSIAPLDGGFGVDLSMRMPVADRWTFCDPATGRYSMPDALIASPELARRWPETVPRVVRIGLGREAARYGGPRADEVGDHRPHGSDHAALVADFPGLAVP